MESKKINNEASSTSNFVTFSDIGGLSDQIKQIRELIVFPLLHSNVFNHFKIRPPRGVLFHGPPGTGKTLVAGAVARECSKALNGRVTFFSRKGADILDKWVGESENRLRKLFEQAAEKTPSIIFFDEIDGLAPIRSFRQDQVHSSVVATLLALMDGLDALPGVIVIGATNRLDAIDPALRRAGRFDRELYFPVPTYKGRLEILLVHTKYWQIKPKPYFLAYLADITVGYCGSDLQALCSEAVMSSLRRNFPYTTKLRTNINSRLKNLKIEEIDFLQARATISPSVDREIKHMRKLSPVVKPLLQRQMDRIIFLLETKAPHFTDPNSRYNIGSARYAARLLITGKSNQGHNHLVPAILHALEHMPSYVIDIQSLYNTSYTSAEEICVQKLLKARQNLPSIVLTYRLDKWWDIIEESTKAIIVSLLEDLHAGLPILIIATATEDLPESLINYFNNNSSILYKMQNPNEDERMAFLYPIFMEKVFCKCLSSSDVADMSHKDPNYVAQLLFSKTENIKIDDDDTSFWKKYEALCNKMTQNRRLDMNHYLEYENGDFSQIESRHKKYKCKACAETKRKGAIKRKRSEIESPDNKSSCSMIRKVRKTANNHVHKARKHKKKLPTNSSSSSSNSSSSEIIDNHVHKARKHKKILPISISSSSNSSSSEIIDKIVETSPAEVETYFYNEHFDPTIQEEQNGLINVQKDFEGMTGQVKKNIKDTSGLNFDNFPKKSNNLTDFKQQDNMQQQTTVSKYHKLASLFRRAVIVTTLNMTVTQLELLYDMLITCISRPNQDCISMLDNIENLLNDTEIKAMDLTELD